MKKLLLIPLLLASLLLAGCSQNPKPVVGAANQFDSDTYLTMVTVDNVIQSTKAALTANTFPAASVASVKQVLNYTIQAYNTADTAYKAYHAAALVGTATTTQQLDVANKVAAAQSAATALTTTTGGK